MSRSLRQTDIRQLLDPNWRPYRPPNPPELHESCTLTIATWNSNGKCVSNGVATPELSQARLLAIANEVDILCLQETKTKDKPINIPGWFGTTGPRSSTWGSAIIVLNPSIEVMAHDSSENSCFITVVGKKRGFHFSVTSVYMAHDRKDPLLRTYIHKYTHIPNSFWAGDWNFVERRSDSQPERDPDPPELWENFKAANSLIDQSPPIAQKNTPTRRSTNQNAALRRLDRIYLNSESPATSNSYQNLPMESSDHNMVIVGFNIPCRPKGKGRFIANMAPFEKYDKLKDKLQEKVSKTIREKTNRSPNNPFAAWDHTKSQIRKWLGEYEAKRNEKQLEKLKELQSTNVHLNVQLSQHKDNPTELKKTRLKIAQLSKNLQGILQEKYEKARLRSRARWADYGEKATAYWLRREQRYQKKKRLEKMHKHDDPNKQAPAETDPQRITETLKEYFENVLYTEKDIDIPTLDRLTTQMNFQLTPEHINALNAPITEKDVSDLIKSRESSSSPGKDGLTYPFYKLCVDEVTPALTKVFNTILQRSSLPLSMKDSIITVIPKGDTPTDLPQNLRPITLTNCDYKIFTCILAKRLGAVLNDLIGKHQTGFIPKRDLRENIISAQLLIDYLKSKNINPAILLLDWEKAFDRVSHKAIIYVIEKLGFPPNFLSAVRAIYSESSVQVLNEGFFSTSFTSKSGTKQGCPLSPLIFVLMAELFLTDIRRSLDGIKLEPNAEPITTQAYADDTLVIPSSANDLQKFDGCVRRYERATGAKLNVNKSSAIIFPQTNFTADLQNRGFKIIQPHQSVRYLGPPISLNPDYHALEQKIINQVRSKALEWHAINPTTQGRAVIIKTKLLSKVWFWAGLLPLSDEFFQEIHNICINFLWKFKTHRLRTDNLYLPKSQGGLKLIHVADKAHSLQSKWAYKLNSTKHNALWINIAEKMLSDRTNFPANICPLSCWDGRTTKLWQKLPSSMLRNFLNQWRQISFCRPPCQPGDFVTTLKDNHQHTNWAYRFVDFEYPAGTPPVPDAVLAWFYDNNSNLPAVALHIEKANAIRKVNTNTLPNGLIVITDIPVRQGTAVQGHESQPITELESLDTDSQINKALYSAFTSLRKITPKDLRIEAKLVKRKFTNLKTAFLTPNMENFEWLITNHCLPTNESVSNRLGGNTSKDCPVCGPNITETHEHRLATCRYAKVINKIIEIIANIHLRAPESIPEATYLTYELDPTLLTAAVCLRFAGWKARNACQYKGEAPIPNNALAKIACLETILHLKSWLHSDKNRDNIPQNKITQTIQKLQTIHDSLQ